MRENIKLYKGDCLELMRSIPDASVDMILCDLPYGTTRNKWDSTIPLPDLWAEYCRICRGAIVLTAQAPFDKVLGASNLPMLRYEWIWEKTAATGHLNAKKAPMKSHENVLVFYSEQPTYNPQMMPGRAYSVTQKGTSKSNNYGQQVDVTTENSGYRYPRSVIVFGKDKQRQPLHPTQKPVALMEYLIRTYTNEGDLVLDNCMGSGTTGVACMNTGRRFIGMEMDEDYFKIAGERIQKAIDSKI